MMRSAILGTMNSLILHEGDTVFDSEFERNLFELRKAKLDEIEKLGQAAYPNQFPASHTIPQMRAQWGEATAEDA